MRSHGSHLAKPAPVQERDKIVPLVKQYDRPEFRTKPSRIDKKRAEAADLASLHRQIAELKDKVRRLSEEIKDEIKMLQGALYDDKHETFGQIERRISRLKGSLEYLGRSDFVTTER